jgi:hypothetical protein
LLLKLLQLRSVIFGTALNKRKSRKEESEQKVFEAAALSQSKSGIPCCEWNGAAFLEQIGCPEVYLVPTSHRIVGIIASSLNIIGALFLRIEIAGIENLPNFESTSEGIREECFQNVRPSITPRNVRCRDEDRFQEGRHRSTTCLHTHSSAQKPVKGLLDGHVLNGG